jgi:hypothetical protein
MDHPHHHAVLQRCVTEGCPAAFFPCPLAAIPEPCQPCCKQDKPYSLDQPCRNLMLLVWPQDVCCNTQLTVMLLLYR